MWETGARDSIVRRSRRYRTLALAAVVLGSGGSVSAASPPGASSRADWEELRERFDRLEREIAASQSNPGLLNTGGELAWGDSYLLCAWVEAFRATGNRAYLRRLTARFDEILLSRDDQRGVRDVFAGRVIAGWGSDRYSGGRWHVWVVHTAMIVLGPARFARTVRGRRDLQAEFGAVAERYLTRIEECVRDANLWWRDGPAQDEGYYWGPAIQAPLPYNQQNAMGSVLLELHAATGNAAYRDRAARLARTFRRGLRVVAPDRVEWSYRPVAPGETPTGEDISHAAINAEFAALCMASRTVFTRADGSRFAGAWLRGVRRPDGSWAATVSGSGDGDAHLPHSAGRWLALCEVVPRRERDALIADARRAYRLFEPQSAADLLGLARLLRWTAPGSARVGLR